MDTAAIRKNLPHLIAAVILIFVLLFVLTRFGYMRCSDVPGFCGIYYSIVGTPRIAIVGGTDGMGDPEALRGLIAERTGRFADLIPLDQLTAGGVLDNYQVIIVDKARKIDTATLKTFSNFVSRGGKLVWIGDAGTQLGSNDLTCFKIEFAYRPGRKTASSELCSALGDSVKIAACVQGRCDGSGMTDDEKKTCERAQGATEQCGDWVVTEPQVPEGAPGICNKTFAGVVHKYIEEKAKVNQTLKQSGLDLCSSNSEIDKRGAE
ncbi:hypothetical protein HYS54_04690, partial [Candidatus Micrarchaeota archaeon]|nr:hypothetical protein [Candidatus Micrarchaeota archaeon]